MIPSSQKDDDDLFLAPSEGSGGLGWDFQILGSFGKLRHFSHDFRLFDILTWTCVLKAYLAASGTGF